MPHRRHEKALLREKKMNITATYRKTAENKPEKIAIHDVHGAMTYKEWTTAVSAASEWLSLCTDVDNRRVGLYLDNTRAFLIVFAAAAKIGWTAVLLNKRWNRQEFISKVRLAGLKLIVSQPERMEFCRVLSVRVVSAAVVCAFSGECSEENTKGLNAADQFFLFGFTSGSTGQAKGFVRRQSSWLKSFSCNILDLNWTDQERILITGSLFHTHFLYAAVCALYLGATVILLPSFLTGRCLRVMKQMNPSQVVVVPTMLETLIACGGSWSGHFHWLCSGAKCAAETKQKISRQFPNSLLDEFYGASELSFVTLCRQEEGVPASSVGRPFSNVSLAIQTKNGFVTEAGRTGEIYVKSPFMISHYVTSEGAQSLPQLNGWVTVGDVGYLDRKGYLYIKGRKNGMINFGGLNIFPEEIERVLQACQGVKHAAVLGIADSHWGEVPAAIIQAEGVDRTSLKHVCLQQLTAYKVPRLWFFVDRMPYTAGGKIDRQRLKKRFGGTYGGRSRHCPGQKNTDL